MYLSPRVAAQLPISQGRSFGSRNRASISWDGYDVQSKCVMFWNKRDIPSSKNLHNTFFGSSMGNRWEEPGEKHGKRRDRMKVRRPAASADSQSLLVMCSREGIFPPDLSKSFWRHCADSQSLFPVATFQHQRWSPPSHSVPSSCRSMAGRGREDPDVDDNQLPG